MVDIYKTEASKDCDAIHIWIPALFASQIVTNHKVRITYAVDDIPTLLRHLEESYSYTLSQITDIVLWCGERISHSKCLELLKKART